MSATNNLPPDTFGVPRPIGYAATVCCVLIAFDFKGQTSGSPYLVVAFVTVMALLCCVPIIMARKVARYPCKELQYGQLLIGVYLATTLVTEIVQQVPIFNYLVMIAPYLLFLLAYWSGSALIRRYSVGAVVDMLFPKVVLMTIISTVWTLYYGMGITGVDIENVRYHLLSVLIPFAVAYLISSAVSKRVKLIDVLFALLVFAVLILAQTRSYLLVVFVALAFATYGHSENILAWIIKLTKMAGAGIAVFAMALVLANAVGSLLPSGGHLSFLEMWSDRLFATNNEFGFDITAATRLAEYDDQMSKLFSSPVNALLGCGLGSPYTYSGKYADFLRSVIGEDIIPHEYWDGGHSLWVYTIYASGVIFGTAFLIFFLYQCWVSLRVLRIARRIKDQVARHRMVTVATGFLAMMATSFTAYPLGSRPMAFLMGILCALQVGTYSFRHSLKNSFGG